MKFFLVFGWGSNVFVCRAFESEVIAEAKASTYNAILVEVHICEKDLQTYVLAHDYEYQSRAGPMPVNWVDEMISFSLTKGWLPPSVPFIRVDKDVSIKRYREEHGEHD